jgi:hypothetical protein
MAGARPDDTDARLRATETWIAGHEARCAERYKHLDEAMGRLPEQIRQSSAALRSEVRIWGAALGLLLLALLGAAAAGNPVVAVIRGLFNAGGGH